MTSSPFPSSIGLAMLMCFSLLTISAAMIAMYVLMVRVELQAKLSFEATTENEIAMEESTLDKSTEDNFANSGTQNKKIYDESSPQVEAVGRRLHLPMIRRAVLAAVVAIITFMTYLLLTKSNANIVLSWLGLLVVLGILLRPIIFEEVRRERLDRLAAIFSLILVLAMALNLAVYANRQHAQGDIYEGKARIVGYDTNTYSQDTSKDTVLRTDLEVAWGGWWGCPNMPYQTCEAFVAGALCESESKTEKVDDAGNRHQWRRMSNKGRKLDLRQRKLEGDQQANDGQDAPQDAKDGDQQGQGENNAGQQAGAEDGDQQGQGENNAGQKAGDEGGDQQGQSENNAGQKAGDEADGPGGQQSDSDIEAKNEELEKENEELEKENKDLDQQNEELQEELDEYKAYDEEIETEIDELENALTFSDDAFVDSYWGETSWDTIWGEYACEDLFITDMEGQTFDESAPPGDDEWPFINIYGNCNTCEAYIVDFYSTEHFQSILSYKRAGLTYGLLAAISLAIAAYLMFRQKISAKKITIADKEIELLPATANGPMV